MNGEILGRLRALGASSQWCLRSRSVCGSTETELERWLARQPPPDRLVVPRVVLARQQRHGHGQHGRSWQAPVGGVWLSAALPWQIGRAHV